MHRLLPAKLGMLIMFLVSRFRDTCRHLATLHAQIHEMTRDSQCHDQGDVS